MRNLSSEPPSFRFEEFAMGSGWPAHRVIRWAGTFKLKNGTRCWYSGIEYQNGDKPEELLQEL